METLVVWLWFCLALNCELIHLVRHLVLFHSFHIMRIIMQWRPRSLKEAFFTKHILVCHGRLEIFSHSNILIVIRPYSMLSKCRRSCYTSLISLGNIYKFLVLTVRISLRLIRAIAFVYVSALWIFWSLIALWKFWKWYKFWMNYLLLLSMTMNSHSWMIGSVWNLLEITCVTLSWPMIILVSEVHFVDRSVRLCKFMSRFFSLLWKM